MADLFSDEWMKKFQQEWNNEPELSEALEKIEFSSVIGYGFKSDDKAAGFIKVENGKVTDAGSYEGQDLNWDMRVATSSLDSSSLGSRRWIILKNSAWTAGDERRANSMARERASDLVIPRCSTRLSPICAPTRITGFSEVMGSWNTMAISRPRMGRSARSSSRRYGRLPAVPMRCGCWYSTSQKYTLPRVKNTNTATPAMLF